MDFLNGKKQIPRLVITYGLSGGAGYSVCLQVAFTGTIKINKKLEHVVTLFTFA